MPRGKGRKVLPYRNAATGRRPPPVARRQVERQNLRRRRPRAQLEQAEDHGVPVQVHQPDDNDPQPAYQPAPAQDHHNENASPPYMHLHLLYDQVSYLE
jgi:predicted TIM-barrel fold metal-dependent hydrolase